MTSRRTDHNKVYQHQLNSWLKRAEKLIRPKSEPIFSEASQTESHEPFDFQTGISGFPCKRKVPLDISSLVLTHGAHTCVPDMINAISAADIVFIMSSSQAIVN